MHAQIQGRDGQCDLDLSFFNILARMNQDARVAGGPGRSGGAVQCLRKGARGGDEPQNQEARRWMEFQRDSGQRKKQVT